ncbi:MAG: hypothetical protein JSW39_09165 [Desulfobacterales bacterium]|nr:MAG: hypothetical protein JSW39_09165 [Desulfobacterales bacterium]
MLPQFEHRLLMAVITAGCCIFLPITDVHANTPPLRIDRITPSGNDVPPGRQIVIQFNQPVVPVGRMERDADEIPITITPAVDCQWRWLNTSALACQLDEKAALQPATRYEIVVEPGIAAENRATLDRAVLHHFRTARPQVRDAWFKTWKAPGMPYIRMTFNQPVSRKSVEAHVFITTSGDAKQRMQLRAEPDPDDDETPRVLPLPGEKSAVMTDAAKPSGRAAAESEIRPEIPPEGEARRVWLVAPLHELASDTAVELTVEPGLVSSAGPEKGAEERVVVAFHTFPEFGFAGIECTANSGAKVALTPEIPIGEQLRCNPLRGVALVFTAPVIGEEVKAHVKITPDLAGGRKDYDPWANWGSYSQLATPHRQGRKYYVWLPEVLLAFKVYTLQSAVEKLRDEFGRPLAAPLDMKFATDHRPPDFTLTHPQAVLEKAVDTDMPLVVTNLDAVTVTYERLGTQGKAVDRKQLLDVPAVEDTAVRVPMGIRTLLGGESGVVQGRVDSIPPVSKNNWERRFFAQITPFQVHVKAGHYNTLVWVVDLASGRPVSDAAVKIYRDTYQALPALPASLSEGITDQNGIALLAGTWELDPDLRLLRSHDPQKPRLFVRVDKGGDMALVPLDYHFKVDTYRTSGYTVYPRMRRRYGHIHTWGTTAQGVYKAGDTIQYKLYVRNQDNLTLVPAPQAGYRLRVIDPMGKTVYEVQALTLSAFGAHHGEFTVPAGGAVGWYRFELTSQFYQETWNPLQVLVSDFTPASFRVTNDLNGGMFQPGDKVEVSTRARLHAGGPYADAPARITATLESRPLRAQAPLAQGFHFAVMVPGQPDKQTVHQSASTVDRQGNLTTAFNLVPSDILYGRLVVESAVRDDRGKFITHLAVADYAGRDRYVGLRPTEWVLHEDEPAEAEILVVDAQGQPQAGVPITVEVERRVTKAARVKGAGNAYLTHYTQQWQEAGRCELVSTAAPVRCQFTPRDPGSYRVTAFIEDSRGRRHSSQLYQWVTGKGQVVWEESQDHRLEIIPEKASYQVGDTARYLVKNPFPGAAALITIERYGVLRSWVQTLETSTPLVEFEVLADFLPGYFLSVVAMSPRVEQPADEGQVDLGKPAFRMGYVQVPVTDPYKEMVVEVAPARETYKPRERVQVDLRAAPRRGPADEPVELAVAVLDESVLDLLSQGRDYFDPYKGFYAVDGLDLENYSLLMRLVGRQKFEKKGANPGGGGGLDLSLRSVFKFVSYWNPSLITDVDGKARIEFEAPDNLTGWRVLALAVTRGDRLGLGENRFEVNRPTEIRPAMPNQVTAGDRFQAGFSVMNRTPHRRELAVTITAEGAITTEPGKAGREVARTLTAEPYKRMMVWLPLQTVGEGTIRFTAQGGDTLDRDGVMHVLTVHKRYTLETAAAYGTFVSDRVTESIHLPPGVRTDVGQVSVVVSPSLISNLEGAFRYLRDYPYSCWEQVLTKGVMAAHYRNLKAYLPTGFKWEESAGLPLKVLEQAAVYQAPNGGMTYYIPEDPYVSPYLSAYTALAFNWLRSSGYAIPSSVEEKLQAYLLTLLRRNVLPDFYSQGMASTVRAVALAALAEHGRISAADLERYRDHVPQMSLFGQAHFLLAAIKLQGNGALQSEVSHLILGHAHQSGGKAVFSETLDDSYTRILASPLRTNGAILSALLKLSQAPAGRQLVGDLPFRLVRFITQSRQNRDHWENTQENVFCLNALVDFSRVYEKESPDLQVRAALDHEVIGQARFMDQRDPPVEFRRSLRAGDAGRKTTLQLEREGAGRVYYGARLSYAAEALQMNPINAGIEIHREYSVERMGRWVLLPNPMEIRAGELVRVDLFVSLPTARNFVVVADPVPGGLEPVNRDLATASVVDAEKGRYQPAGGSWWFRYRDWSAYGLSRWSFYHQERRHEVVRFYSEYLPAGNYHLSYTAQAIAPGEFIVMPVRAEEMYDPDVFGKGAPATLKVCRE